MKPHQSQSSLIKSNPFQQHIPISNLLNKNAGLQAQFFKKLHFGNHQYCKMVAIKNIWSRHVSGSYKTVCLHLIFDNSTRVYKFFAFSFPFFFKNLSVTNWQLLLKFQLPNIFFSCHGNQNGCNLELCKDPLWVWVGPLQVNQVVFLARHFTPCYLLIQSFQSQCIRMVFLIFFFFF